MTTHAHTIRARRFEPGYTDAMNHTRDTLLEGLTDAQERAVTHLDGPLLVLAGPGSGKTTVVTRRVAHLIAQGIPAWSILALTFTNKAAGEMRERIHALLPEDLPGRRGLTVCTFHSLCARLLRQWADEAKLPENFSIYDSSDQRDAIKQALKDSHLDSKNFTPASVAAAISNAKNRLCDAEQFAAEANDFYTRSIAKVFRAYQRILYDNGAVDFDDLLVRMAKLLRDNTQVREALQERYQYVLVDEYQDTNHAQFVIAHSLAAAHKNICVVGDPDQSIYGWRGADIRNILEFEEHYPDATIVPLGQNFRSTAHIVNAAAELIRRNSARRDKHIYTELDSGEKPQVVRLGDEHAEARHIVSLCKEAQEHAGISWKDMAVLYRVNSLSRVLEDEFRAQQVPYVIARGTAFYDRKEIRDALSYLRVLNNPDDDIALRRIVNMPTRGIGKTSMDRIERHALKRGVSLLEAMRSAAQSPDDVGLSKNAAKAVGRFVQMFDTWRQPAQESGDERLYVVDDGGLPDLVERVIRDSGLEAHYRNAKTEEEQQRLDNLEELVSAAADFTPGVDSDTQEDDEEAAQPTDRLSMLAAFLESVTLVSDADAIDPENGAVTLMTLHAAKGLEFDFVAMAGLEQGLLPHARTLMDESEQEEERRLCFVGMTRARRRLVLTHARRRMVRGVTERAQPSVFLKELPEDGVDRLDLVSDVDQDMRDLSSAGSYSGDSNQSGLTVGTMVRHRKFGVGRVESITPRPTGSAARVNFQSVGPKTLIVEFAGLQPME